MTSPPLQPIVALSPEDRRTLSKLWMRLQQAPGDTAGRPLIGPGDGTTGPVNLQGDVTGSVAATRVVKLQGNDVGAVVPHAGQALVWDGAGTRWVPGAPGTPTGQIIDYTPLVNQALTGSGATATASSSLHRGTTTSVPGAVIDNDDGTYHQTEPGVPPALPTGIVGQWVRVDLGSAKAITYARWHGMGPAVFKIQSSPDGTTWTDRFTGTGSGPAVEDTGYVDLGAAYTFRYWRLLATQGAADDLMVWRPLTTYTLALYTGLPLIQAPGHVIQDEGTQVLRRTALDFAGQGVTVSDDPANDRTIVTIPGDDVYATDVELTAAVALLIARSLIDAKGDLIVGTADNTPGRLGAGADGQVLTAHAASSTGLIWAPGSSVRYEPLTNGDPSAPELVFDSTGDVIMVPVP